MLRPSLVSSGHKMLADRAAPKVSFYRGCKMFGWLSRALVQFLEVVKMFGSDVHMVMLRL
mgnify:CR=1 FL=1